MNIRNACFVFVLMVAIGVAFISAGSYVDSCQCDTPGPCCTWDKKCKPAGECCGEATECREAPTCNSWGQCVQGKAKNNGCSCLNPAPCTANPNCLAGGSKCDNGDCKPSLKPVGSPCGEECECREKPTCDLQGNCVQGALKMDGTACSKPDEVLKSLDPRCFHRFACKAGKCVTELNDQCEEPTECRGPGKCDSWGKCCEGEKKNDGYCLHPTVESHADSRCLSGHNKCVFGECTPKLVAPGTPCGEESECVEKPTCDSWGQCVPGKPKCDGTLCFHPDEPLKSLDSRCFLRNVCKYGKCVTEVKSGICKFNGPCQAPDVCDVETGECKCGRIQDICADTDQACESLVGTGKKVFICHATGSRTNPYVLIHVSKNACPAHERHQGGRDIILGESSSFVCNPKEIGY